MFASIIGDLHVISRIFSVILSLLGGGEVGCVRVHRVHHHRVQLEPGAERTIGVAGSLVCLGLGAAPGGPRLLPPLLPLPYQLPQPQGAVGVAGALGLLLVVLLIVQVVRPRARGPSHRLPGAHGDVVVDIRWLLSE